MEKQKLKKADKNRQKTDIVRIHSYSLSIQTLVICFHFQSQHEAVTFVTVFNPVAQPRGIMETSAPFPKPSHQENLTKTHVFKRVFGVHL